MKRIFQVSIIAISAMFAACDDFSDDLVKDNKPEIPVTYVGATTYGFNPYYTVPISGTGDISITMEIPAASGKTIKQIKRVIAGATGLVPGNLSDTTVPFATDLAVNSTSATFSTTIAQYNSKVTTANRVPATIAAGTFVERAFMFLIVLDDDSEIIPVQCRIRFTP